MTSLRVPTALGSRHGVIVCLSVLLASLGVTSTPVSARTAQRDLGRAHLGQKRGSIELSSCPVPGQSRFMLCGSYEVFENRASSSGRKLVLDIAVLPARKRSPKLDPIFWVAGGPGDSAVGWASRYSGTWLHRDRDLVMVDQRGAGSSAALLCDLPGGPTDIQGYMETYFARTATFRNCKTELQRTSDLRKYTTPIAMDDLNEVREAMGYGQINLMGSSYGTRAALVYARRHPGSVRSLLLKGLAPVSYTTPLYHSEGAQRAIDLVFSDCAADPACSSAFPEAQAEFWSVLDRLEEAPVDVQVVHPETGETTSVSFPRTWFAEAMRLLLYRADNARWVPYLVNLAHGGDYTILAQYVVDRRHAAHVRGDTIGMLLSVTCPEDLARFDSSRIPELTEGTFAGDERVRQQMAVCRVWPKGKLPSDFGDPVVSAAPALLWSGSQDPVTPPKWGDAAAAHLSNSLHLVIPAGHAIGGKCVDKLSRKFIKKASVRGLSKKSCLTKIKLPPFVLSN